MVSDIIAAARNALASLEAKTGPFTSPADTAVLGTIAACRKAEPDNEFDT